MIQRQRIAVAVTLFETSHQTKEIRVVQQPMMGERRRLRRSGGAGGELNIDRVIRQQHSGQFSQPRMLGRTAHRRNFGKTIITQLISIREMSHDRQMRQAGSAQPARRAIRQFRREFPQDPDVVGGPEAIRGDQRPALDFVQRIFQFRRAIGRIDVHQDQPGLGGRILREHPFDAVGRPETDAVAGFQAQHDQTGGDTIDLVPQRGEGQTAPLVAHHDGLLVRPTLGGFVQGTAQRVIEQWGVRRAMEVATGRRGHGVPPEVSFRASCRRFPV